MACTCPAKTQGAEWSGNIGIEMRYFPESPMSDDQYECGNLSLFARFEFYHNWNDGSQSVTFVPFFRADQNDNSRTHLDINELYWQKLYGSVALDLGINKVFWGVTESQHIVDIINQTDAVENPDMEDKLGQPMLNLAITKDWGNVDLFVLPYFRERTFPGKSGRLRLQTVIDVDNPAYESSLGQRHVDWALRWFQTYGEVDIGLSHFYGTAREPELITDVDGSGAVKLVPYYAIINQTAIDVQWTHQGWLWKMEAFYRSGQEESFSAVVGGFEYTFYGLGDSVIDMGVLLEYLYDERGDSAPSAFEDDLFAGLRIGFNDAAGSELLAGAIFDLDTEAKVFSLEFSRRYFNNWKLNLEMLAFSQIPSSNILWNIHRDDFIQLEIAYHL
jgi:hypothetical protein